MDRIKQTDKAGRGRKNRGKVRERRFSARTGIYLSALPEEERSPQAAGEALVNPEDHVRKLLRSLMPRPQFARKGCSGKSAQPRRVKDLLVLIEENKKETSQ